MHSVESIRERLATRACVRRGGQHCAAAIMTLASLTLLVSGCQRAPTVDETYGVRRGYPAVTSVNGTAVLASMFEDAGFHATSSSRLSLAVERAQVVVWAPDNFALPQGEVYDFFEDWLYGENGRTLVYVARDYDAAPDYWRQLVETGPVGQVEGFQRALAQSQSRFESHRRGLATHQTVVMPWVTPEEIPATQTGPWFTVERRRRDAVHSLSGPWSAEIDAEATDIVLYSNLRFPQKDNSGDPWEMAPWEYNLQTETLLATGDGQLLVGSITRPQWRDSRILVVTNGSWLLNLPLVNREHRKLANRLITSCGPPGSVVFVETGPAGARISQGSQDMFWQLFRWQPLGTILMHLFALGMLYCFAVFPIFGRPRTLVQDTITDFGNHVIALGKHMSGSHDAEFAQARLQAYHQHVRRDSGVSHVDKHRSPLKAGEPKTAGETTTPAKQSLPTEPVLPPSTESTAEPSRATKGESR